MIRLIKNLLGAGKAWRSEPGTQLRELLEGLAGEPDRVKDFFDEIRNAGIPGYIPDQYLSEWEEIYDLLYNDNLTDEERQDRILSVVASMGGQGADYLEQILQDRGFPFTVYDNIETIEDCTDHEVVYGPPRYDRYGVAIEYNLRDPGMWDKCFTGIYRNLRRNERTSFLACSYHYGNQVMMGAEGGRLEYSDDRGETWEGVNINQSASFNGVNSVIECPDIVTNPTGYTFSFWFRRNGAPGAMMILFYRRADANNHYFIWINSNGYLCFLNRQGGVSSEVNSFVNICDNVWNFCSLRLVDATTVRFNINNGADIDRTLTVALANTAYNFVRIGTTAGWGAFSGQLDEFRIFDSLLTDDQISTLYHGGEVAGAYLHYDFEYPPDFGLDVSGNARHGVAANVTLAAESAPIVKIDNADWKCGKFVDTNSRAIAGIYGGRLYLTTNGMDNFYQVAPAGNTDQNWNVIDITPGLGSILAGTFGARLWHSADVGVTWNERRPVGDTDQDYIAVAISGDGTLLMAACNARLYYSTDSGVTWNEARPLGDIDSYWHVIAMSADHSRIYVAGNMTGSGTIGTGTGVWLSEDDCVSWICVNDSTTVWLEGECDSIGSILLMVSGQSLGNLDHENKIHICYDAYNDLYNENWQVLEPTYNPRQGNYAWIEQGWHIALDRYGMSINPFIEARRQFYASREIIPSSLFHLGEYHFSFNSIANGLWYGVASDEKTFLSCAPDINAVQRFFLRAPWVQDCSNLPAGAAPGRLDYGDGYFIIVDFNPATIYRSDDRGETWETIAVPFMANASRIRYGNGVWIITNLVAPFRIARSVDNGATWTEIIPPEPNIMNDIATDGNGVWIIICSTGASRIFRSDDDGATWAAIVAPENNIWNSIAYSQGIFCAVAGDGVNQIIRSDDLGLTWETVLAPELLSYTVVRASEKGVWLAYVTGAARVIRSVDGGRTWQGFDTPLVGNIFDAAIAEIGNDTLAFVPILGNDIFLLSVEPAAKDNNIYRFDRYWKNIIVLAGATIDTVVNIPAEREQELKRILYLHKPAQTWAVTKVNYT